MQVYLSGDRPGVTCLWEESAVSGEALIGKFLIESCANSGNILGWHRLSKHKAVEREAHDGSAWWGTSYRWVDRGRIQRIGSMTDAKSPRRYG